MTYADVLRPSVKRYALLYDIALITVSSFFIALSAQITILLPFSPVPITGQTLAVLLTGALLGSRRGSLCIIAYLIEGATGLPVFAGGQAGLAPILGPTGGYLIGFIAAAYLTGLLAERGWDRRFGTTILAMLLGNIVIYVVGLPYLASFLRTWKIFPIGLYPFIPGDLLKVVIAATLLPSGWKILGKRGKIQKPSS